VPLLPPGNEVQSLCVPSRAVLESGEELRLKETQYYFCIFLNRSFWNIEKKYWLDYSPGKETLHSYNYSWSWQTVCSDFAQYLSRLRQALETDDPWKQSGVTRVIKQQQGQTLIPAGNEFTGQRLARLIFAGAKKSLDISDPYIGPDLFDRINDADVKVPLRLLTSTKSKSSASYFAAFKKTYANAELRVLEENKLHDRFIIVDGTSAYHVGHSIKDLGKKDSNVSPLENVPSLNKLFEERWAEAKSFNQT